MKIVMSTFSYLFTEDHIGNSRDHSFVDLALNVTNGKGCDVVFSCVRGELKHVRNTRTSLEFSTSFESDGGIMHFFRIH